jgi:nitroreductase
MNATGEREQEKAARFLLDTVVWAPSVHNTQPWWFGTRDATVTVHADLDRRLQVADPDGREMLVSCGAALYTLRLAIRHLGHRPSVRMLTDPERPGLVADVTIGPPEPATGEVERLYAQIRRRRTHRGGFRPEGLPAGLLRSLRDHAYDEGVTLRVVADPGSRIALAALTEVAEQTLRSDPAYRAELARWAPRPGSGRPDGVHEEAYPRHSRRTDPYFAQRDFARGQGWGLIGDDQQDATGVVAVLTTDADARADWLRAGQALQRVLLRAAADDVSAAFHSQALEIPELRDFLRVRHCGGAYPQMIMRLGVAASESEGVRRPPADVSRPEP